jgi:hypothetical protein
MGKKRFIKKTNLMNKVIKNSNSIVVLNRSLSDILLVIDGPNEEVPILLMNSVIAFIGMLTMAQITISARPEGSEYVDKLPSIKDIKSKILTSFRGRTLSALVGLTASFPYMMNDPRMKENDIDNIITFAVDQIENPSPNTKRIRASTDEWPKYARGEASAAFGQMLSCPISNLKTLNISADVGEYGLDKAIEALGVNEEVLNKHNITKDKIITEFKKIFLVNEKGMPIEKIEYHEPTSIKSKIQEEIFGNLIFRNGNIGINLVQGMEPDAAISKSLVALFLNPRERIAYKFAIESGDKNILRKYTEMIRARSIENAKNKNLDN